MEHEKFFPTNDEIKEILLNDEDNFTWPTTVPQKYGTRKLVELQQDPLAEMVAEQSVSF